VRENVNKCLILTYTGNSIFSNVYEGEYDIDSDFVYIVTTDRINEYEKVTLLKIIDENLDICEYFINFHRIHKKDNDLNIYHFYYEMEYEFELDKFDYIKKEYFKTLKLVSESTNIDNRWKQLIVENI
jgi:hypothetical protein